MTLRVTRWCARGQVTVQREILTQYQSKDLQAQVTFFREGLGDLGWPLWEEDEGGRNMWGAGEGWKRDGGGSPGLWAPHWSEPRLRALGAQWAGGGCPRGVQGCPWPVRDPLPQFLSHGDQVGGTITMQAPWGHLDSLAGSVMLPGVR